MPFYIRKSFGAGPLRLNLSKSGFGLSAGVTGARVGLSSDGRMYVHGGRHGLYYRKYFSKSKPDGEGSLHDQFIDTGVTFPSRIPKAPVIVEPQHWWTHPIFPLIAAGLISPWIIIDSRAGLLVLLFATLAWWLRSNRATSAKKRLAGIESIQALMDEGLPPSDGQWPQDWVDVAAMDWMEGLLADHRIDTEEKQQIQNMMEQWPISLTVENHLRASVDYYHELFLLMDGPLEPLANPSRAPQRDEEIYLEATPSRLLQLHVLKRFQRQGVRYTQRGFEVEIEGTFRITSKVIEFDDGDARAYKIKHIQSVELRVDDEILQIQLANRKNPIYVSTPQIQSAAAVLKRVMDL